MPSKATRNAQLVPEARFRLQIKQGVALGPGKAELLQRIAAAGSIRAASQEMGMGYLNCLADGRGHERAVRRPARRTPARRRHADSLGFGGAEAHQCLLSFGHGGYDRGPMEQRLRDVLGYQIGDGTAQIMKTVIARVCAGRKNVPT